MTPARVLHLINGEYFGGSARVLMNYLAAPNRTAQVMVGVFFRGELERRLRAMGIETHLIPMRGRLDVRAARDVVRLARRHQADIVHTHQVRNTLIGRLAARTDGRRVVTHVHSPAFRESTSTLRNLATGSVDRLLARWSDRFVAVSHSLASEVATAGVPADRIRVVSNGVPLPAAREPSVSDAVRAELGLPASAALVGMVANFRPRKGAEVLIEAMGRVRVTSAPPHLLMVGEPFREGGRDYGAELARLASEVGIGERTVFTGFRPDAERLVAALDILVLPSLFGEGLPMALLESMGAGGVVISTPVEGIAELIRDGENGVLVPAGDVDALAGAIDRLLGDTRAAAALGEAARRTIQDGYTDRQMAAGIEAVYGELLER